MATQKQIEANRLNAQKSTGPKTPEGKAAVRLNALRHGLRAKTVVLPGEKRENFDQLCDDLEAEWRPQSRTEQLYLEQMAIAQWKLARAEVAEASLVSQTVPARIQLPLLDRIWQNQRRLERSFTQAQRELERLQRSRRRPVDKIEQQPAPEPEPAGPEHPDDFDPQPLPKREYVMDAPVDRLTAANGVTPSSATGRR